MNLVIEGEPKNIKDNFFPHDKNKVSKGNLEKVTETLTSGKLSLFNNTIVEEFEKEFRNKIGTKYCSSFTNCTSALDTAIRSVTTPGDEVIIPAYTYMATLMAVLSAKCKPVLVDINKESFCIDEKNIEEKITDKTKVIIPVHIFGNPSKMNKIMDLAKQYNLRVIEDCAHALNASYKGKKIGSYDIGCHSFGENKILRLGEGGAITTNDNSVFEKSLIIRHEGEIWNRTKKTAASGNKLLFKDVVGGIDYITEGHNFRISPIISALGIDKLKDIDEFIEKMNANSLFLKEKLSTIENIKIQKSNDSGRNYSSFVAVFTHTNFSRDEFLYALAKEGVPVGVHFPIALNESSFWNNKFGNKESFPNAKFYVENHFALPIYPTMERHHLEIIVEKISLVIDSFNARPNEIKEKLKDFEKSEITNFYSGVYINV